MSFKRQLKLRPLNFTHVDTSGESSKTLKRGVVGELPGQQTHPEVGRSETITE